MSNLHAQEKMIVFLTDKNQKSAIVFSERSEMRRTKNNVEIDSKDIPVSKNYIDALSADGQILNESRWLNAITIETNLSVEELQLKHEFIDHIWTIKNGQSTQPRKDLIDLNAQKAFDYGNADTQVRQINANCLHDLGYTGIGVYLAVIDAGFKGMDTITYFDSIYLENRVIDKYDFINNTTDVYDFSSHGTAVSSCIFAEKLGPNAHIGTAVDVDIALYVSEDASSETLIEEFNLVVALERCDVQGVDVANISLGYLGFDDPSEDHVYNDLDGVTTIAAIGVNTAASKGIVVVTSAGNSGPSTISTPCDADSCLCVGAIDGIGNYAPFSSVGPSADGQIKPDVVAMGKEAWVVIDDGQLVSGNGTSFSSPVMAGAVACLIQANPTATVEVIIQSIRENANQFLAPDEFIGYGIPDFCSANDFLEIDGLSQNKLVSYPNPTAGKVIIKGVNNIKANEVQIINILGASVVAKISVISNQLHIDLSPSPSGIYFCKINGNIIRIVKKD